ncbi:hypothetical protein [Nocardioides sp. YIM 152315]|uniref:hypothetical protein n=1 Tax=Nocardioides sp. YIM 152315 TaxID=3031760 RepID=UPI0023DB17A4|nr:hypothetical protein [Nocardioides sp. YIM 152315]MDF1603390.1 hypothetical protein [Nocardioides sp. YIM 152315]
MKRTTLTPEQAAWLDETIARNHALFGGWSMDASDSGSDDDGDDSDKDDDADGDDSDDDGKDDDAGTDWKAKFEAEQRHKRNLERKTRKDAATIARLTGKKPEAGGKAGGKAGDSDDDGTPDIDQIKADAKAEAEREALEGRVEDKIEAKAAAFADPEDAVAVLLRSRDIEDFIDDGKVDVDSIVDALKELGEKKPHLLAQGGKRFQGDADGGTRKEKPVRAKSLGEAISRHYEKS